MLAMLMLLALIGIYLAWRVYIPGQDWRASILSALVSWGTLIALSTEFLNLFKAITWQSVLFFWLLTLAIAIILVYRRKDKVLFKFSFAKPDDWLEQGMLTAIASYLGITLLVAIIAPPNTNDALQYHMSRVMHWMVNRSVDFYITPIDRQLWMPPFGEYTILHFYLLAGSDRFANLIQWLSSLGAVTGVSLIASQIGINRKGQVFAALFAATIPMAILQASSAQTDYLAAFWGIALTYFVFQLCSQIIAGKPVTPSDAGMLGLAFGLGALSKGTFYAIALPVLACLLAILLWKKRWKTLVLLAVTGLACGLLINLGIWGRNYAVYGSPLGPAANQYGSSTYAVLPILSTAWRNAVMQFAFFWEPVNQALYTLTQTVHRSLGLDLNDPRITVGQFNIRFSFHEDFAGNGLQFLLFMAMAVIIPAKFLPRMKHKRDFSFYLPFLYTLVVILGYLLISALFKWQETNNRLFLPWFLTLPPMAAWGFQNARRPVQVILPLLLILSSLPVLLANPSRPLVELGKNESILTSSRFKALFNNSPEVMNDYISVVVTAKEFGCKSYGLEMDSSDPEYLVWAILTPSGQDVDQVEHFLGLDETTQFATPGFHPCVVFCSICNLTRDKGYEEVYKRGELNLYVDPAWNKP